MKIKKSLPIIFYTSWSGLGFIRGLNSYKYYHKKNEENENLLYLNLILNGIFGIGIYCNPFFFPFTIYKEIYRLEIIVRNLENEKKGDFYNKLL